MTLQWSIRMIEYDFAIGIEHAEKQGRRYRIEFPKSCVLFLRSSGNTPDYLEADVVFPDGNTYLYSIPTIKMADYTKDSIFEKNLLMLLPFYIMRYEKKGHDFNNNPELFQVLLNEYERNPGKSGRRTDRNRKVRIVYRFDETNCKNSGLYFP